MILGDFQGGNMKIQEKAKKIKKLIKQHKTIFIVGHKNLDLDALGSALGIYHITQKYNKKSYIIVDDKTHELGVEKIINEQQSTIFITSQEIDKLKESSSLLIIVDTNKSNYNLCTKTHFKTKKCAVYFRPHIFTLSFFSEI